MRLHIKSFGQSAEGIELSGNPKSGEPAHVRIAFPGGDVEVVRATDGVNPDYWVHVRVDRKGHGMFTPGEDIEGRICDARLDQLDKNSSDADLGDFNRPELYHVALRVRPQWESVSSES